jgi:GNAT superfamily N-acetyltransferase
VIDMAQADSTLRLKGAPFSNFTPAFKVRHRFACHCLGAGVDFDMSRVNGERLTLDHISVAPIHRGQGRAAKAIRLLCELADKHRVTIDLEVGHDDAGIDLCSWYTRHGFVWREGFMERSPR